MEKLIATASRAIEKGDREDAAAILNAALRLDPACLAAHNLIERHHLPGNFRDAFGVCSTIAPTDDIFRFFAGHPSSRNPIRDYLSDGWRTLSELLRLLESMNRRLGDVACCLEFASGFGRFTRHLVQWLGPERVQVSDVVDDSVDFLRREMGVSGFYSTHDPAELRMPADYDLIFVLSLFSHLPRSSWSAWLDRLYRGLAPGGVLVFSTHGEKCARLAGLQIPADGFAFIPSSESQALPGEEYGCCYTAPAFVRAAIREMAPEAEVREFPAHFWGNQDAFAVGRPRG